MLPDDLANGEQLKEGVRRARKTLSDADKSVAQGGAEEQVRVKKKFQKIMEDNLANAERKLEGRQRGNS